MAHVGPKSVTLQGHSRGETLEAHFHRDEVDA